MEENRVIQKIADIAVQSLVYEVSISPKPGLVDRFNNGAHRDMNYFTFLHSAYALGDYFYSAAKEGYYFRGEDIKDLFQKIRPLGVIAEQKMFEATNGVNTHKGLIFSLGIISCAAAQLVASNQDVTADSLSHSSMVMTRDILITDFGENGLKDFKTNGERLFHEHGVTGIRGEAVKGFDTALHVGFPVFKEKVGSGYTVEDAGLIALLHIMKELSDTNILSRHDFKTLAYVKKYASDVLKYENGLSIGALKEMDRDFIHKNISPGGAADNLAIIIAVYYIEKLYL